MVMMVEEVITQCLTSDQSTDQLTDVRSSHRVGWVDDDWNDLLILNDGCEKLGHGRRTIEDVLGQKDDHCVCAKDIALEIVRVNHECVRKQECVSTFKHEVRGVCEEQ